MIETKREMNRAPFDTPVRVTSATSNCLPLAGYDSGFLSKSSRFAGIGTLVERFNAASWFCGTIPLLVTEVILQGRKILKAPSASSSVATGT